MNQKQKEQMENEEFECDYVESDLRLEKGIAIPAILLLLAVSLPAMFFPDETQKVLKFIFIPLNRIFGSSFLWLVTILVGFLIYFALSRYGDIKFGAPDEKPEFSLGSWSAMIFCSGVAGACMFWAIVEPAWYLLTPPLHAEPMSPEAYEWSLSLLLLNWGPTAWSSYFVCALPIAYMIHIRCKPLLRVSAASEIIIGKHKDGFLGRFIDCCFILGLMFCTAFTMCISLPTVEAALCKVFDLTPSLALQGKILLISGGIAAVSVYLGLKRGIQRLSDLNVIIAAILLIFVFLMGPSALLFDSFTAAVGRTANNFLTLILWTDPYTSGTVPQDWTMLYAMNWLGYGPFMGLFIARISRGRTIREIIGYGLLCTVAGGYLIHGIVGSYTLYLSQAGLLDVTGILQSQGGAALMAEVLGSLPLGSLVLLLYCAFSTIFLATSVDSSCYVMAASTTRKLNAADDPHRFNRLLWAVLQSMLAMGSLTIGGLDTAKMLGNFAGLFMCIPVVLLAYAWLKIIKTDGNNLLKKWVPKVEE